MMASHSPGEMLGLMTTADNYPPLYYLLLSAVISIFGDSVWALRLLSVLGAIGLVSLGAGPVRRTFGNRTAFIYAGVVLFNPVVLIYAHEARMYSLASFCVTASALYGYLAVKYNSRRDWVAFGLASLAAAYLHYYGLMAAFFMHLLIFLWLFFKKRETLKSYLVTAAAVIIGYLPWLVFFYRQVTMVNKGFWIPAATYFQAPPSLLENRLQLYLIGLGAALILVIFGLYALSGAGSIRHLPLLRLGLTGISSLFLLRGLFFILSLLTLLGIIKGEILVQGVVSDLVFLAAGITYAVGTVLNWREMQIRRKI